MTFSPIRTITPWVQSGLITPRALPISLHQPPPNGTPPIDLPMAIVWDTYNIVNNGGDVGVSIQLSQLGGQQQALDAIRSIYVDNTNVSMPVYVQFGDTNDVIYCPPYSTVIMPIYTNILNVIVYAKQYYRNGSITTVHFCNFSQDAYVSPASIPEGPEIISVDQQTINGAANSFDFNTIFIGNPDIRRHCTVFCYSQGQQVTVNNQPIITVGGVMPSIPSYFSPYAASFLANPPGAGVYTNVVLNSFYIPNGNSLTFTCNFIAKTQNMCAIIVVTYLNGSSILGASRSFGVGAIQRGAVSPGLIAPGSMAFGWFAYNNNGALPNLSSTSPYTILSLISDETNKYSVGLVSFGVNATPQAINLIASPSNYVAVAAQD